MSYEYFRGDYGMPRIRAELTDMGIQASRKRIARLMHDNHLHGVSRRRGWCVTTERNQRLRPAPDLVERKFAANDRLNPRVQMCPWKRGKSSTSSL